MKAAQGILTVRGGSAGLDALVVVSGLAVLGAALALDHGLLLHSACLTAHDLGNGSSSLGAAGSALVARHAVHDDSLCVVGTACVAAAAAVCAGRHSYSGLSCFLMIRSGTFFDGSKRFVLFSEEYKKSEPFSYRKKVRILFLWCTSNQLCRCVLHNLRIYVRKYLRIRRCDTCPVASPDEQYDVSSVYRKAEYSIYCCHWFWYVPDPFMYGI